MRPSGGLALTAAACALLAPGVASAHLHETVGPFTTVVGWLQEPAVAGQLNGLDIRILRTATGAPVTGAEKTLKAVVRFGNESKTVDLAPQDGKDGAYQAPLLPTAPGDYTVVLTGTVDGVAVHATYDLGSDPDMVVRAASDVAFPVATPPAAGTPSATAPVATPSAADRAAAPTAPAAPVWAWWSSLALVGVSTVLTALAWASRLRR
jgi:hypothetical protein